MGLCWPVLMPPTPKAVLISLADQANDHGSCWPSLSGICVRTCFGRTAVIEAIRWLEDNGYLSIEKSGGRNNRYALNLTKLRQREIETSPADGLVRETNQSASRTTTSPAGERVPVREANQPVRQADPNRKEPIQKEEKKARAPSTPPRPEEVEEQVWNDWLALRARKRAPVTTTVLDGAREEARKADMTLGRFLAIWCMRGSQGLEAAWLKPNELTTARQADAPWHETRDGVNRKAQELGMQTWEQYETEHIRKGTAPHYGVFRLAVVSAANDRKAA
jgi:hypothetical protein